jgi:hypothetical protein
MLLTPVPVPRTPRSYRRLAARGILSGPLLVTPVVDARQENQPVILPYRLTGLTTYLLSACLLHIYFITYIFRQLKHTSVALLAYMRIYLYICVCVCVMVPRY